MSPVVTICTASLTFNNSTFLNLPWSSTWQSCQYTNSGIRALCDWGKGGKNNADEDQRHFTSRLNAEGQHDKMQTPNAGSNSFQSNEQTKVTNSKSFGLNTDYSTHGQLSLQNTVQNHLQPKTGLTVEDATGDVRSLASLTVYRKTHAIYRALTRHSGTSAQTTVALEKEDVFHILSVCSML